ncbi:hypothetical protein [Vibrio mangrovi]|uniref:Uncharacterized protein n=1 Tax=Vibrio mangrovi TaxID=474394 RepID=A0A1Y6IYF8_9VIBR|nr:hypothetical protein [Vibrio mangrovi]MDW6005507.1 hypothetical protein [Vibrio mangrovi]SMS02051.1 hypothetical protein VIM7927_03365 [Vibrio mangrovi]
MNRKTAAYHYSYESNLFVGTSTVFIEHGYDHYIKPQCATFTPPPEHDSTTQQCRYLRESDRWEVEAIPEAEQETQSDLLGSESSVTNEQTSSGQSKPGAMRRLLNRLTSR